MTMTISRIMYHTVWWSIAMAPFAKAISRDPLWSSYRTIATTPQKCQLVPHIAAQRSVDIELELLVTTRLDGAGTMELSLIKEIDGHIFDCLSVDGSSDNENARYSDNKQSQQQNDNSSTKLWNRRAREIGILALTVTSVTPGMFDATKK